MLAQKPTLLLVSPGCSTAFQARPLMLRLLPLWLALAPQILLRVPVMVRVALQVTGLVPVFFRVTLAQ